MDFFLYKNTYIHINIEDIYIQIFVCVSDIQNSMVNQIKIY